MHYKKNIARGILVSPEDEYLLHKYLFHVSSYGYACTRIDGKYLRLNRLVLPVSNIVDHISRDKLDNRRSNLRSATPSQSMMNRRGHGIVGYKGVSRNRDRYRAQITVGYLVIQLGTYDTPEQAAIAYNKAALKHHGEFACTNEIT